MVMYKIDRRGGGGVSKNRILGQTQHIKKLFSYLTIHDLNIRILFLEFINCVILI